MAKWNLEWFIAGMLGLIAAIAAGDWLYIGINFIMGLHPAELHTEGMMPLGSTIAIVLLVVAVLAVAFAGMSQGFFSSVIATSYSQR